MVFWPPTVKSPWLQDNVFSKIRGLALEYALSKEYITGSCKKDTQNIQINGSGALANGTVYKGVAFSGRAGKITAIYAFAQTAPVGGTNSVTMTNSTTTNSLLAAPLDPTTLTSGVVKSLPLTAVASDLAFTAATAALLSYSAGTQGTAASNVQFVIEFENNDF